MIDQQSSTFTKHELERLAAYRGAVAAGLYSDWDGSASAPDTEFLSWLKAAPRYPFMAAELEALERCRQAVASGYYTEDLTRNGFPTN